jgi:MFS family permease
MSQKDLRDLDKENGGSLPSNATSPAPQSAPPGKEPGTLTVAESTGYLAFLAIVIYLGWGLINTDGNLILILSGPIITTLHLTIQQYSYVVSAGFFASFVLSLILGPLGDRLGRRFVLQLTLAGTAFLSMLQYFINSFLSWFLIRIGAGAFTGSEWGAGGTVLAENFGKRFRGLILSIMQSGWVFGYGLASLISLLTISAYGPTYGWRVAFLFAFLPALLIFVIRFKLKDPKRFEHVKAVNEAKRKGDQETLNKLLGVYNVDVEKVDKHPYRQLFSSDLLRTTLVLAFWNFLTTGIAITTNAFQPVYFEEVRGFSFSAITFMFTIVSFAGILGYIANGFLNDRIGAKYSIIIFALLEVVGIYLTTIVPHNIYYLWPAYILFFFTENGQFSALIRLNTEAYPTRSRATGAIWGGAWWSLGQAVWPLLFGIALSSISFNAAWYYVEILPEVIGVIILAIAMKNIPPRKELEEIHV